MESTIAPNPTPRYSVSIYTPYTLMCGLMWVVFMIILILGFYCGGFRACCRGLTRWQCGERLYRKLFGIPEPDSSAENLEPKTYLDPPPEYEAALHMKKPDYTVVHVSTVSMDYNTTQIQPSVSSEDLKCLESLDVRPTFRTQLSRSESYLNEEDPPSEERTLQRSGSTGGLPSYDEALHMLQSSPQLEEPVMESTWIFSFA